MARRAGVPAAPQRACSRLARRPATSACCSTSSTPTSSWPRSNGCWRALGRGRPSPGRAIALPIGISFFTFQKISYLVDVYRGTAQPARGRCATTCSTSSLFPQLIAGPIVRYHDVARADRQRADHTPRAVLRRHLAVLPRPGQEGADRQRAGRGGRRGFGDAAGRPVAPAARGSASLCYSFQIYFDFSGYSDMAIGLGRMLGFEFLENFNRALHLAQLHRVLAALAHLAVELHARIPVRPARRQPRRRRSRTYLNLWIVFLLSGFWHGAAWNFVAWGAFHGFFLSLDKLFKNTRIEPRARVAGDPGQPSCSCCSAGCCSARDDARRMPWATSARMWMSSASAGAVGGLGDSSSSACATGAARVAAAVCFGPAFSRVRFDSMRLIRRRPGRQAVGAVAVAMFLLVFSASVLATSSFNPFIYFRF